MPNNCSFSMSIEGKTEDIKEFTKLFIFDDDKNVKKPPYFARTFLEDYKDHKEFLEEHKEDIKKGEVDINGWCAWSCWSCWFEGYPNGKECVTLEWAMKKYNIKVDIESEEGGHGFEEKIETENKKPIYSSKDMPVHRCNKCGNEQIVASYEILSDVECCECESYGFVDELQEMVKEKLEKIKGENGEKV